MLFFGLSSLFFVYRREERSQLSHEVVELLPFPGCLLASFSRTLRVHRSLTSRGGTSFRPCLRLTVSPDALKPLEKDTEWEKMKTHTHIEGERESRCWMISRNFAFYSCHERAHAFHWASTTNAPRIRKKKYNVRYSRLDCEVKCVEDFKGICTTQRIAKYFQ